MRIYKTILEGINVNVQVMGLEPDSLYIGTEEYKLLCDEIHSADFNKHKITVTEADDGTETINGLEVFRVSNKNHLRVV